MIPLVYIQSGWFPFFELAVHSARQLHPDCEIIHIGDRRYLPLQQVCDFEPLSSVPIRHWGLRERYVHHSPNTVQFERFCIERWFHLLELMKRRDWLQCWVFDSDTLLFANFEILAENYRQHGLTINGFSPHATFIAERDSLERFCRWVISVYEKPEALPQRSTNLGWGVPGISDMTLLTDFGREVEPIGDNSRPTEFGLIDNNLNMAQGMVHAGGRKVICQKRGVPYVETTDGQLIALNLIHFQGAAKKWMPDFQTRQRDSLSTRLARWTTQQQFQMDRRWKRIGNSLQKRVGPSS